MIGDEGGVRLWLRSPFGLGSNGYVPVHRSASPNAPASKIFGTQAWGS